MAERVQKVIDGSEASRIQSPGPAPADEDLVAAVRAGDPDAFGQLMTRYQDRVYNLCYRMSHSHADALDLTQAAFVQAWRALPHYEGRSTFFTWLFRIACNLTLTHKRKRRYEIPTDTGNGELTPMHRPTQDAPDANLLRDELRTRLESALAELDESFRVAVLLKDVEGLDYAAISEILGLPLGTIKSRIHRGRMMLRDLLSAEDDA